MTNADTMKTHLAAMETAMLALADARNRNLKAFAQAQRNLPSRPYDAVAQHAALDSAVGPGRLDDNLRSRLSALGLPCAPAPGFLGENWAENFGVAITPERVG